MAHLGRCAYCGLVAVANISAAIALRKRGETIYCDAACRAASAGLRQLFDDAPTVPAPCRHRAGTFGGRCIECGALERGRR